MLENITLINTGTALVVGGLSAYVAASCTKQYFSLSQNNIDDRCYTSCLKVKENSYNLIGIGTICLSLKLRTFLSMKPIFYYYIGGIH